MKQSLLDCCTLCKGFIGYLLLLLIVVSCSERELDLSKTQIALNQIDSLNNLVAENANADIESIQQSDSLFKLSMALGYEKGMAAAACNIIKAQRKSFQYEDAMHFLAESLTLFENFNHPAYQADVYDEIGALYFDVDDYDQAYSYLTKALDFYEKNNNQAKQSAIYSRIGIIFKSEDKEKSLNYLRKSIAISTEIADSNGIARDLNNIALIYQRLGLYDTARSYYRKAMPINAEMKNWDYYATNLLNLAIIEKLNQNVDGSIELFSQLIPAFDSLNQMNKYAKVLLHLGDAYLNKGDYEKAITFFTAADSIGRKYAWLVIERNANWGLYSGFYGLGNSDSAIKYLNQQYKIGDSLRVQQNYQELTRLELQYKNNQFLQQKMWNQKMKNFILYSAITILLIFVALIYQLFKKQKLKVAKQMLERKVLQNELDEKERELTSFVLNMVRLNEKKLGIINYLKKQKHRLKKENQDVIDTAIRDLEFDQDAKVWEEFELRFNKVNSEFYQKLANLYPDLTLNEKRLCAFLLMNMTTKEISSITGQSVDAIGKARTRLRKKLGITNQDDGIADVLSSL